MRAWDFVILRRRRQMLERELAGKLSPLIRKIYKEQLPRVRTCLCDACDHALVIERRIDRNPDLRGCCYCGYVDFCALGRFYHLTAEPFAICYNNKFFTLMLYGYLKISLRELHKKVARLRAEQKKEGNK